MPGIKPGMTSQTMTALAQSVALSITLEILQVGRLLALLAGHDGAVTAEVIDLVADGDPGLTLRAIVLGPPHSLLALEGLHHGPRPRQRAVGCRRLDPQRAGSGLVEIDPLLD